MEPSVKRDVKICLIRPSIVVPANNATTMFTPPLGLTYVAGALRNAGFQVQFIDAVGESLDTRHPAPNDCFLYGLSLEEIVCNIDPGSADSLGAECGCELTAEDLQESMELSDEELDDVADGYAQQARIERPNTLKVNMLNDTENRWQRELNLITAYWGNNN